MTLVFALYGGLDVSFEKLSNYFEQIKSANPRTHAKVESFGGHFHRSFFLSGFSARAVKYCQPVIALDGTHLKGLMNLNGTLLVASAKDPNNSMLILGLAIVPVENGANWTWFLKHLKQAGVFANNPVVISDRLKGLINSCKTVLPYCAHRFCMRHIVANIRSTNGASSADHFEELATRLSKTNMGAYRYLTNGSSLPRECWVTYAFVCPTFGNVTSNLSESANNWIGEEVRSSDVVQHHFKYMMHMLENVNDRRKKMSSWPSTGITPFFNKALDKDKLSSKKVKVHECKPGETFLALYDDASAPNRHIWRNVNIANRTCDCSQWFDNKRPCIHAIACMHKLNISSMYFGYDEAKKWRDMSKTEQRQHQKKKVSELQERQARGQANLGNTFAMVEQNNQMLRMICQSLDIQSPKDMPITTTKIPAPPNTFNESAVDSSTQDIAGRHPDFFFSSNQLNISRSLAAKDGALDFISERSVERREEAALIKWKALAKLTDMDQTMMQSWQIGMTISYIVFKHPE
ncbi:hypothetical protein LEN26_013836 [Aphanomyces euteiches]|nr:hypothetical protein LEN26_013836 [Aphanomyces euteiches]